MQALLEALVLFGALLQAQAQAFDAGLGGAALLFEAVEVAGRLLQALDLLGQAAASPSPIMNSVSSSVKISSRRLGFQNRRRGMMLISAV